MAVFSRGEHTLLGHLIYIVRQVLDVELKSNPQGVRMSRHVDSERDVLSEMARNSPWKNGWQIPFVRGFYWSSTPIFEGHTRPQTTSTMPIRNRHSACEEWR